MSESKNSLSASPSTSEQNQNLPIQEKKIIHVSFFRLFTLDLEGYSTQDAILIIRKAWFPWLTAISFFIFICLVFYLRDNLIELIKIWLDKKSP